MAYAFSIVAALTMRRIHAFTRGLGEVFVGIVSELGIVLVYAFALRGAATLVLGRSDGLTYSLAGMLGATAFQAGILRGVTLFIARDIDYFLTTSASPKAITLGLMSGEVLERSIVSWAMVLVVSLFMHATPIQVLTGCAASSLLVAAGLGLGASLAARTKNPFIVLRVVHFVMMPQNLICGAYFPVPNQGPVIEVVRNFLPAEYGIDIFHAIFADATTAQLVRHSMLTNVVALTSFVVLGGLLTSHWMAHLRGRGPSVENPNT